MCARASCPFSAYLLSARIRQLYDEGRLALSELDEEVAGLRKAARETLQDYFRQRHAEEAATIAERIQREEFTPTHTCQPLRWRRPRGRCSTSAPLPSTSICHPSRGRTRASAVHVSSAAGGPGKQSNESHDDLQGGIEALGGAATRLGGHPRQDELWERSSTRPRQYATDLPS